MFGWFKRKNEASAVPGVGALKEVLEAYRKAWADRVKRDAGEVISTPEDAPRLPRLARSAIALPLTHTPIGPVCSAWHLPLSTR